MQRPRRATKGLGDRPWGRFAPTLCPHSVAGPTLPTPSLDRPQRRVRPPWAAARFACRRRDRRRPPKLPPGRRVLPSSHDEVSLRPFRTSPRPGIFADCFPQQKVFQDELPFAGNECFTAQTACCFKIDGLGPALALTTSPTTIGSSCIASAARIWREGKFVVKSISWNENQVFLKDDKLEVAVKSGRLVMAHLPTGRPAEDTIPDEVGGASQ